MKVFVFKGLTSIGGDEKWYHPDVSQVHIRPNGQMVRIPSNQALRNGGYTGTGSRVDRNGNIVRPHTYKEEEVY